MKEIPLTRGFVAWVDDEDYERLSRFKWHTWRAPCGLYYATRWSREVNTILMHREILGVAAGTDVDHVEHRESARVVDNRKCNLRIATQGQNNANRRKQASGRSNAKSTSVFKGVSWDPKQKRWRSQIKKNDKYYFLGGFKSEANAAYAYDLAAVRLFGEFALPNFPVPGAARSLFGVPEQAEAEST